MLLLCGFLLSCGGSLTCGEETPITQASLNLKTLTFPQVGIGQGIQVIGTSIFLYGQTNAGTFVELDSTFNPTGWVGQLTSSSGLALPHTKGLAYKEGYPTFLGFKESIHLIDWEKFYQDKNLDNSLLKIIASDRLTKPEYIYYNDKWYVASAQYEAEENEIILMDPDALSQAATITDPGVIVYRFPTLNFIQELFWNEDTQSLTLVQNIQRWHGWRLTTLDPAIIIASGKVTEDAILSSRCILIDSELEGYAQLADGREVFLTAASENNFFLGSP